MFRFKQLTLVQFKNYLNRSFDFEERTVGISGRNGIGKTNLLDAIHYLCFTRSYFTRTDSNNILQGHAGFRLEAAIELTGRDEQAVCILRETGKKEFLINGQSYEKFSQHIGHYPCVIIAPDDVQIITGPGEERRRFIDTLLAQVDPLYLQQLITYNKVLQQRNSLLRHFAETGTRDLQLLAVLDEQLVKPGDAIFERRKEFLLSFLPVVKQLYQDIARQFEDVSILYESELQQASFAELIKLNQSKDIAAMRTTSGIHRDDLDIMLNDQAFKNIASQGQRKSLLFALKLGEMTVLQKEKGFSPILLLDDVFEKLDEDRITNLLERVCLQNEGQVFITDTNAEKISDYMSKLQVPFQSIRL